MFGAMYFYGLFSKDIDEDFFRAGKLYNIKTLRKSSEEAPSENTMFWKIRTDGNFLKSSLAIPNDQPLVYLGVHECYMSRFHMFLYGEQRVFTIGLVNQKPSKYWEEAVHKT